MTKYSLRTKRSYADVESLGMTPKSSKRTNNTSLPPDVSLTQLLHDVENNVIVEVQQVDTTVHEEVPVVDVSAASANEEVKQRLSHLKSLYKRNNSSKLLSELSKIEHRRLSALDFDVDGCLAGVDDLQVSTKTFLHNGFDADLFIFHSDEIHMCLVKYNELVHAYSKLTKQQRKEMLDKSLDKSFFASERFLVRNQYNPKLMEWMLTEEGVARLLSTTTDKHIKSFLSALLAAMIVS
jgi:hypothetical protein